MQHMEEQCLVQEEELTQQCEMLEAHRHEWMQQEEELKLHLKEEKQNDAEMQSILAGLMQPIHPADKRFLEHNLYHFSSGKS